MNMLDIGGGFTGTEIQLEEVNFLGLVPDWVHGPDSMIALLKACRNQATPNLEFCEPRQIPNRLPLVRFMMC